MNPKLKVYKILFLIGMAFEITGQVILSQGSVFLHRPIDFAHWFLLLGVVLMIPQIISFPDKIFSYIGIPIAILGVTSYIGMCVIDFTLWSYQPDMDARNEFIHHLSQVPAVWKPFITIGPKFLTTGLVLLSFNYYKENKMGVTLVVLGLLIYFIPLSAKMILVFLLLLIGYSLIFFKPKSKPNE